MRIKNITRGLTLSQLFAIVVVEERQKQGMWQKDLATAMKMSQANWSKYEAGEIPMTIEKYKQVCDILKCDMWDMLKRTQDLEECTSRHKIS